MPKNIKLPNGTIVRGVPDDMNKYNFMAMTIDKGLATPEDYGQESVSAASESGWENYRAGIGRGLVNTARQIGNIVGLVDDEYMEEMKTLDTDLMETGAGQLGSITGELAATAPLGGVAGSVGKGVVAARRAGTIGKGLARALTHPATRGALEGATVGSIFAGPGERGKGALTGGAIGGAFGGVGKLVGRAYGKFKLASQTPDAKALQETTGTFIPLSQSAEPGIVKQLYEGLLSNIPGVGGKVRGQYRHALDDLRRYVASEAHPPQGQINILAKDTVHQMMGKLDDYWAHAYDDIADEVIDISKVRLTPAMREAIKEISGGTFAIPRGTVQGAKGVRVLQLKNAIQEMMNDIPAGSPLQRGMRKPLQSALTQIDRSLKKSLPEDLWQSYSSKSPYYKSYMDLAAAAKKAGDRAGQFSPKQLAGTIAGRSGKAGMRGEARLQQTADQAVEALPDFPSKQGIFQTMAALGFSAGVLAGVGTPVGAGIVGVIGLGKFMASKGFQKVISGQHNNAARLVKYQRALKLAGYSGRQISAIVAAEKENAP